MSNEAPDNSNAPGQTPTATTILDTADYSQYLLKGKGEVLYVLRSLATGKDPVAIHFNAGHDFLLSTVIAVSEDGLILDYGGSEQANQLALQAQKLYCTTTHDKVRVQFSLDGVGHVRYEDKPAFRAKLPTSVLRLQRREFFRLTTPIAHPIQCKIPLGDGRNAVTLLAVNVVDISGGGLAMMAPPENMKLDVGDVFEHCKLELPEVGNLEVTLTVRSVFDVTLRSGARVRRAGCQFMELPGTMLNLIQRYIIKTERERKARASGIT